MTTAASKKPRYQQLKEAIVARIASGELKPRDRVPSENELVETAGVSRMTANRALRELTDEGYVQRITGVGTFVAEFKAASDLLEVRNIADEIGERGHVHSATLLYREREQADSAAAAQLGAEVGEPVFRLRVLHKENETPIQLEERVVLASFAADALETDFTRTTPSAWLSRHAPMQEAEHTVRAVMAEAPVRRHLAMGENEACLLVIRRTWVDEGIVSYARLWHPGSRFELTGHIRTGRVAHLRRRYLRGVKQ